MTNEEIDQARDKQVTALANRLIDYYAWYFEASKEAEELRLIRLIKLAIKSELFAAETRGMLTADKLISEVINPKQ